MKTSLQKRFLIIFSSIILITVFGMQLWNYNQSLKLVKQNENEQMELMTSFVSEKIDEQLRIAKHSLLPIIHSHEVQQLFANEDREGLQQYMMKTFQELEKEGITQLQFHTKNAISFFRAHQPEKYGDDLSNFRKTVVDANKNNEIIEGLEEGVAGYGFRVVAPIEYDGKHIGSVEVGNDFGNVFLTSIQSDINGEYFIYEFENEDNTPIAATVEKDPYQVSATILNELQKSGKATYTYSDDKKQSIVFIPFKDFQGDLKGYIKGVSSREATIAYMNSLTINAIVTGIISLIIVLAVTYYLIRSITRPIRKVALSMERIADGDLTIENVPVNTKDEIGILGAALNTMIDNLRSTLFTIYTASEQVAASSEELMASAEETTKASEQVSLSTTKSAERTESQLRNVNEVTETMEEMATGMDRLLENSEQLLNKTTGVSKVVLSGNESVTDVVLQMNSIHHSVEQLGEVIQNLNLHTKEIDNIVKFITDISDQTNLLALNAAIEAARAGEAGKGFAVVADEVRKLAEQSAESASKITSLIETIHSETNKAVGVMQENAIKVNEGLKKTDNAREAFQLMDQSIIDVNQFSEEVSASVEEMVTRSEQIVDAIGSIKEAAETNTMLGHENSAASEEQMAAMEEISSASEFLAKLSEELQKEINKFKL